MLETELYGEMTFSNKLQNRVPDILQGRGCHHGLVLPGLLRHGIQSPSCEHTFHDVLSSELTLVAKTSLPHPDSFHYHLCLPVLLCHGHR
jgi:hypothetical protein